MMGLIPASEVVPIHVFKGVSAPQNTWVDGVFYADSEEVVSIEQIIEKQGAREPDYTASQKDFRGLVIVVSDTPVQDIRWKEIISDIQNQEKQGAPTGDRTNFWTATGGRATLSISGLLDLRK